MECADGAGAAIARRIERPHLYRAAPLCKAKFGKDERDLKDGIGARRLPDAYLPRVALEDAKLRIGSVCESERWLRLRQPVSAIADCAR